MLETLFPGLRRSAFHRPKHRWDALHNLHLPRSLRIDAVHGDALLLEGGGPEHRELGDARIAVDGTFSRACYYVVYAVLPEEAGGSVRLLRFIDEAHVTLALLEVRDPAAAPLALVPLPA